jgi:outer membrane protein assembly factor BamB
MQHQPTPLADGRLLLFDNRGRSGQSRVVEIDPSNGALLWEYAGPPSRPLRSPEGGSVQRLGGGNTLITESEQGRALEVTHEGVVVWEFVSPHRAGPRQELVATLFEVIRYPLDHAPWLPQPSSAL